jgi:hypothetical protein
MYMNVGIGNEAAQFIFLEIHKSDFRYSVRNTRPYSCSKCFAANLRNTSFKLIASFSGEKLSNLNLLP